MIPLANLLLGLFACLLNSGQNTLDIANDVFSSFIAVSGDAHQAKVAQDLFRQEVRYERSLQIREDIRDVNKLMMESVQTHVIMGSVILGACFAMAIEGHLPDETSRLIRSYWLVFVMWAATFTLVALWLALRFQMKTSCGARGRLLRTHRVLVPDDKVVGRMGGHNLVNQVAHFHSWFLGVIEQSTRKREEADPKPVYPTRVRADLRLNVGSVGGVALDVEPLRKGMHAWIHSSGHGYAAHTTLDVPYFLVGETLVKNTWEFAGEKDLSFRVWSEATLYITAQCPPLGKGTKKEKETPSLAQIRKALQLEGRTPTWPAEQLPFVVRGFHEKWEGPDGYGEFRRVDGFTVWVDHMDVEMPLYKIVLASPDETGGFVDVTLRWNFSSAGCEGLLTVVRQGQVHCKEDDWPLAEFAGETENIMPLRHYSGIFLRNGIICLNLAAVMMNLGRSSIHSKRKLWWCEACLSCVAVIPAVLTAIFVDISKAPLSNSRINKKDELLLGKGHVAPTTLSEQEPSTSSLLERVCTPVLCKKAEVQGTPSQIGHVGTSSYSQNAQSDNMSLELHTGEPRAHMSAPLPGLEPVESSVLPVQSPEEHIMLIPGIRGAGYPQHETHNTQDAKRDAPDEKKDAGGSEALNTSNVKRCSTLDTEDLMRRTMRQRNSLLSIPHLVQAARRETSFLGSMGILWASLKNLYVWTAILHFVFVSSVISIAFSPLFLTEPKGIAVGYAPSLSWTVMPVSWPPFFRPNALAFSGTSIYMGSQRFIREFRQRHSDGRWISISAPLLLSAPVRGLGMVQGQLMAVDDTSLHSIGVSADSASENTSTRGAWDLIQRPPDARNQRLLGTLPGSKQLSAAAVFEPPSGGNVLGEVPVALVVAEQGAGVHLCRDTSRPDAPGSIEVLAGLRAAGTALINISGVHVCDAGICSSEPVLWIATPDNSIIALGLASGETLAKLVVSWTHLSAGTYTVAALAGNSTHLVAAVGAPGRELVLLSTRYPQLPGISAGREL